MVSINAHTGLLYTLADWQADVRQDLVDRLVVPLGSRVGRPAYGLPTALASDLAAVTVERSLESGEGAAEDVDLVVRVGAGFRADVTVAPPPALWIHSRWERRATGQETSGYTFEFDEGDHLTPQSWVRTGDRPRIDNAQIAISNRANASGRFRLIVEGQGLWHRGEPGYDDQYESWIIVIESGVFSQSVPVCIVRRSPYRPRGRTRAITTGCPRTGTLRTISGIRRVIRTKSSSSTSCR